MREPPDIVGLVTALAESPPEVMERDELVAGTGRIAQVKAWADAMQVQYTRRIRELAEQGRAEAARDVLAKHGHETGKGARDAAERETTCSNLPNFEEALAAGSVSSGHVDAISQATRGMDQAALIEFNSHADNLLADAERTSVDTFGRNCRDLATFIKSKADDEAGVAEYERQVRDSKVKRWTDRATGMRMTLLAMDPLRDAKWWAGVQNSRKRLAKRPGTDRRPFDQQLVDAVVDAALGQGGKTVTQVHVLIDYRSLFDTVHERTLCELDDGTPLPVALVRQLACEADIIPIVLNGKGRALDVGRSQRLATEAQRQALRAMHRTCVDPDCEVPGCDADAHHVEPWERLGETDLANLAPACRPGGCHTKYHEGGWTLEIDPDRTITITRPDGSIHYKGTSITRAPNGVAPIT